MYHTIGEFGDCEKEQCRNFHFDDEHYVEDLLDILATENVEKVLVEDVELSLNDTSYNLFFGLSRIEGVLFNIFVCCDFRKYEPLNLEGCDCPKDASVVRYRKELMLYSGVWNIISNTLENLREVGFTSNDQRHLSELFYEKPTIIRRYFAPKRSRFFSLGNQTRVWIRKDLVEADPSLRTLKKQNNVICMKKL